MKLDESDKLQESEELNGILEKPNKDEKELTENVILKMPEKILDDGESPAPNRNVMENGADTDLLVRNSHKNDDSGSSSSVIAALDEELSEDSITLRLSEDEDDPAPSDNLVQNTDEKDGTLIPSEDNNIQTDETPESKINEIHENETDFEMSLQVHEICNTTKEYRHNETNANDEIETNLSDEFETNACDEIDKDLNVDDTIRELEDTINEKEETLKTSEIISTEETSTRISEKEDSNECIVADTHTEDTDNLREKMTENVEEPIEFSLDSDLQIKKIGTEDSEIIESKESIEESKVNVKDDHENKMESKVNEDADDCMLIDDDSNDTITKGISLKRLLETPDKFEAKKMKTSESNKEEQRPEISLEAFKQFMEKKLVEKLTKRELEEFCIQKALEVYCYHSEVGKVRHQLQTTENQLETWKNKFNSVKKQLKDLEVVNMRLLTDIKSRIEQDQNLKDVAPVKITRSVGLQVAMTPPMRARPVGPPPANIEFPRRRQQQRTSLPNRTVQSNTPTPTAPNKSPVPTPIKQIKTLLPKTPDVPNGQNSPKIVPNKPTTQRKASEAPKAVIDLTDEDDSTSCKSTTPAPPLVTTSPPTTTSSVRMIQTHPINNTATVATNVTQPRMAYLVHQGQQPVIFATATQAARPGQTRPIMFKSIAANTGTRMNMVQARGPTTVTVVQQGVGVRAPVRMSTPMQRMPMQPRNATPKIVSVGVRQQAPIRPNNVTRTTISVARHPAPLPGPPPVQSSQPHWKSMPPQPSLKISRVAEGIVLSWRIIAKDLTQFEEIASYQLYAYQETSSPPDTSMWRKVGDVKALALPMACTLTQFAEGNKYHFAVRAVDIKSRVGPFSQPEQIMLK